MTPPQAAPVVREWDLSDQDGWTISARAMENEHNAAIRHLLAEIEGLNVKLRDMTAGFSASNEILDREGDAKKAAEIRAVVLQSALRKYGYHNHTCSNGHSPTGYGLPDCDCGLAAALGEKP